MDAVNKKVGFDGTKWSDLRVLRFRVRIHIVHTLEQEAFAQSLNCCTRQKPYMAKTTPAGSTEGDLKGLATQSGAAVFTFVSADQSHKRLSGRRSWDLMHSLERQVRASTEGTRTELSAAGSFDMHAKQGKANWPLRGSCLRKLLVRSVCGRWARR